jgi:hypothetical protein
MIAADEEMLAIIDFQPLPIDAAGAAAKLFGGLEHLYLMPLLA